MTTHRAPTEPIGADLTPISRATSAIVRPASITRCAASRRYFGVQLFRLAPITTSSTASTRPAIKMSTQRSQPQYWTRDWLGGFGQRSGCRGPFVGGGAGMTASGVASFGVVAGQPSEALTATGRRVGPAGADLQDSRLRETFERFGQHTGPSPQLTSAYGHFQLSIDTHQTRAPSIVRMKHEPNRPWLLLGSGG